MLDQLRPGDTVVVWRLDRLGRSLSHLVQMVNNLADQGSLPEASDTSTAAGRLVFNLFAAALAEFQAGLIRENTHAGLPAARACGRLGAVRR